MENIYTEKPRKNNFDLSHEVKMTGNMGQLMPCYIQDVIPGDSYKVNTQQLIRFSPLLAPIMHSVDFKLDYFFVPYRIVWSEWKDFITGGESGTDLPSCPRFTVDQSTANAYLTKGSLADYMGIPPSDLTAAQGAFKNITGTKQSIDILKFRAYQLIWHEYFRDQNLNQNGYEQYTNSGIQTGTTVLNNQLTLRNTNWSKDYFTSALPFLQRGAEVKLPLGSTAPLVFGDYRSIPGVGRGNSIIKQRPQDGGGSFAGATDLRADSLAGLNVTTSGITQDASLDITQHTAVDLTNATATTINELRKASALQRYLEIMARAGSRYREQIHAIFGERIPDYTVQIPKYLGGGKTPVMISEVLSTYQSEADTANKRPQGDMSGHALALGENIGFTENFDEHGVILGVCRVVPKASYCQGLSKFWQKFDKFDYFFPQFANLGEQEINAKEIYVRGNDTEDKVVFGYQQRYAEYKYKENMISGDFRDTLNYWELSRRFSNTPTLNESFVQCRHDADELARIFAITDANEDKLWMSLYHKVSAIRPIPYFSNPSLT